MTPDEILEYLINVFWGGYLPSRCRGEQNDCFRGKDF
jgi:hypothetical protein